jgi:hypothetical protein
MSGEAPADPLADAKPVCGGEGFNSEDYDFPLHLAAVCKWRSFARRPRNGADFEHSHRLPRQYSRYANNRIIEVRG